MTRISVAVGCGVDMMMGRKGNRGIDWVCSVEGGEKRQRW